MKQTTQKDARIGTTLPDMTLYTQDNKPVALQKCTGITVLYFYPKDDTPGCTKQACSLREGYTTLTKQNITIYGISKDSAQKHHKFKQKYNLPFDLLVDEQQTLATQLGVLKKKWMFGKSFLGIQRTTIIAKGTTIVAVITKPDVDNHAEQILNTIKQVL